MIDVPHSSSQPRQVVILAGGRGSRLAPLTDTMPKPMLEFHGRPFLEYLIRYFRGQGFDRVLLLLGYLPDVIRDYFGDGSRFGVTIEYSITDPTDDTGRRILLARDLMDPVFLLAYCDNYCPLDLRKSWSRFAPSGAPMMVTVYTNEDGFTRNNLRVGADGYLEVYDKSRTSPNLKGVDIGFMFVKREILDRLPNSNCSFEKELFPALVAEHRLLANVTRHRYYSVGNLERLPQTETFLARRPTLILDRDGTMNRRMGRAEYVTCWEQWEWLPGVLTGLKKLKEAGVRVIVVTNQPGVARGAMTETQLASIHERMQADVQKAGGEIAAIYFCPHNWDEGCDCRKPSPGMLHQAQRDFLLDLTRTPFFGDDDRDGLAAEAAGCPFVKIDDHVSLERAVEEHLATMAALALHD